MINIRKIVLISALLMSVFSFTAPTYATDDNDQGKQVRTFPKRPPADGSGGDAAFKKWQHKLAEAYFALKVEFKDDSEEFSKAVIELFRESGPLI